MADLIKGFRDFIFRGNIIELAIAFVIGVAFANVISSLVSNLFTPLITMILGEPGLYTLDFTINDSIFSYGAFLDSLITFIAIAAAVYFIVVVPMNKVMERSKAGEVPADVLTDSVAAVSVGIVEGEPRLDLCYEEDAGAEVDFNVVMTGGAEFVEVQGTAEVTPFDRPALDAMLDLAAAGVAELTELQRGVLAAAG